MPNRREDPQGLLRSLRGRESCAAPHKLTAATHIGLALDHLDAALSRRIGSGTARDTLQLARAAAADALDALEDWAGQERPASRTAGQTPAASSPGSHATLP